MNHQNEQKAAKPNIMLNQVRMAAADELPQQVNLFTGTVAFPLDLALLENNDHTNQLRVSAYYDSNVLQTVQTWNQDAPTGVLGVGWELPLEKISVDPKIAAMSDDEHYYLQQGNNTVALLRHRAEDDSILYQTDTYTPWIIRFVQAAADPLQSYWEIIREDGQRYIYGAILRHGLPDYGASNTQEYRSRWGNWAGSSLKEAKLYPVSWYLAQIIPPWDKTAITFAYDSTFIPLGKRGVSGYTRSIRLREIVGCGGQSIHFNYAPKETFECSLPYETPASKPDVFQFSYEENYLQSVESRLDGKQLTLTELTYEFHRIFGEDETLRKRYLREVRHTIRGAAQPAYCFSYYADPGDANAGALKSILYPEGAAISYTYEKNIAASVKTDITTKSPGTGYEPLIFHGADYAVVAWQHKEKHDVRLCAYSWNGVWTDWQSTLSAGSNTDELEVLTQRDFFVIRYRDPNADRYALQICRRDAAIYGSWTCRTVMLPSKLRDLTLTTGENFIACASANAQKIIFLTYDTTSKDWLKSDVAATGAAIYLTGDHNNCVVACYDDRRKALDYRLYVDAGQGNWRLADNLIVSASIDIEHTYKDLFFSGQDSFLMSTFVNSIDDKTAQYTTLRLILSEAHKLNLCDEPIQYEQSNSLDFPFNGSSVTDTTTCNTTHPARYDGEVFIPTEIRSLHDTSACRCCCDNDLYILAEQTSNAIRYTSYAYDPYNADWRRSAPEGTIPGSTVIAPQISGSYAAFGGQVYFKNSCLQWRKADALPPTVDPETVCLRGQQGYLLYQKQDNNEVTYIQYLRNGHLAGAPQKIHQKIKITNLADGRVLAGGMLFATFSGDTYERADKITLHYASSFAENGALCPRTVSAIAVNDGYQTHTTRYAYDGQTAAFDPYGQTAMFTKVQIKKDGDYGIYEKLFYNNAFNHKSGAYAAFMNGHEQQSNDYDADGRRVYEETTQYEAVDKIGDARISGICIRPIMKKARTLGIAFSATLDCATGLETGAISPKLVQTFSAHGFEVSGAHVEAISDSLFRLIATEREYIVRITPAATEVSCYVEQTTNYAYNVRGQIQAQTTHAYTSSGQKELQRRETLYAWEFYPAMSKLHMLHKEAQISVYGGPGDQLISRTAQKYNRFPNGTWDCIGEWCCSDGEQSAPFSFDDDPDHTPDGWVRTKQYISRNACGMELESSDLDGIITSYGYGKSGLNRIWCAMNAAASCGEADYTGFEAAEATHGYTIVGDDKSVALCRDEANTGKYSYKIVGVAGSCGLQRTFSPQKADKDYVFSLYAKTETALATKSADCGIRMTVNGVETYLPIATGGKWEYVHCILKAADYGGAIQTVEIFLMNAQPIPLWVDDLCFAALDGGLTATVYDDSQALAVAQLSATGALTRTSYDKYGRPAAASRQNRQIAAIQSVYTWREGGQACFDTTNPTMKLRLDITGDGYYEDFTSSDAWKTAALSSGSWSVTDGALRGIGALTFGQFDADEAFLAFRLKPSTQANPALLLGGQTLPLRGAADYLVLLRGRTVMLFADGRSVGRIECTNAPNAITLQCDKSIELDFFSYGSDFAASAEYLDNCGRTIQKQLFDEQQITVSAQLYDATGHAEITTKPCRLEERAFAYRPDFITMFDKTTGRMEGEVSACWPEDENYPYSRIRREASPLARELERGLPGAAFAIHPDIPYEKRNTAKVRYLVNSHGSDWANKEFFRDLPVGCYDMVESTDVDGLQSYKLIDGNGRKIAAVIVGKDDVSCTFNALDAAGRIQEVFLPNYYADQTEGREKARILNRHDFCGRLVYQKTVDMDAATEYSWDDADRLRFILDPVGASHGYVLFRQYDHRGRIIAEGYFDGQFTAELKKNAKNPAYLPTNAIICKRYSYGDDIDSSGRLVAEESSNEAAALSVKETFSYDRRGLICAKSQQTGDLDQTSTAFRYDAAGRLTQIICDETLPEEFRVLYRYNNRGLLAEAAYQSGGKETSAARYAYTPSGTFAQENLPDNISRTFSYDSAERLTGINDRLFSEQLSYNRPDQTPGGRMTTYSCEHKTINERSAFARRYSVACAYDAFGRLSGYDCNADGKAAAAFAYDYNTNLTRKTQDEQAFTYHYQGGSNRLNDITDGGTRFDYTYDEGGNTITSERSGIDQIAYTRLSRMVHTLKYRNKQNAGEVKYAYTATDFLSYRESPDGQTVYIRDLDGRILQEKQPNSNVKPTYYVQGHGGIAAIIKENDHYTLIKDQLGSTRLIVKDGIPILGYNYLPYGEFVGTIYRRNNAKDVTRHLFCGHVYEAEIGVYNLGARLYEPQSGRFLSVDAVMQSPSPYAYVNGNPLRHTDQTGESFLAFLITTFICAAITAVASGIVYLATTKPKDYSAGGFFKSVGIGFAAGLICGFVSFGASAAITPAIEGLKTVAKIAWTVISEVAIGCASATVAQISANAMSGVPIDYMLGEAAIIGAVAGLIMGAYKGYKIHKTSAIAPSTSAPVENSPTIKAASSSSSVASTTQAAQPENLGIVAKENLASNLLYAAPATATEITKTVIKDQSAPPAANPQRTRLVLFADAAGQLSYI